LAKGFEEAVVVEAHKEGVILLKLYEHWTVEELYVFIVELSERGNGGSWGGGRGEGRVVPEDGGSGGERCAGFEERSACRFGHDEDPFMMPLLLVERLGKRFL
jgi:hypothetical protein